MGLIISGTTVLPGEHEEKHCFASSIADVQRKIGIPKTHYPFIVTNRVGIWRSETYRFPSSLRKVFIRWKCLSNVLRGNPRNMKPFKVRFFGVIEE